MPTVFLALLDFLASFFSSFCLLNAFSASATLLASAAAVLYVPPPTGLT